jgi:DNA-binding NarL/FixJ family response regulator/signal transduction histidine kinase
MHRFPRLDRWLAVAFVVLGQLEVWVVHTYPGPRGLTAAVALVRGGALLWRRRAPVAVLAVQVATSAVVLVYDPAPVAHDSLTDVLAGVLALYAAGAYTTGRARLAGVLIAGAGVLLRAYEDAGTDIGDLLSSIAFFGGIFGGTWLAGYVVARHRARTGHAEARAGRAEAEREERARQAVAEERTRIARELHDVVAHAISVIVLQAKGGRRLLDTDPAETRVALDAIVESGEQALGEMRRLLGMLRRSDAEIAMAPLPSLRHLELLAEQVSGAGLPVELAIVGEPAPLPPGVDLSAYRIVQEALTNALKHAGPARARVVVRYGARALELEITDTGRGAAAGNGDGGGARPGRHARAGAALRRPGGGRHAAGGRLRRPRAAAAGSRMTVRVLLADDQRLVRHGLRMILRAEPDIDVVGEAGDGQEAVELAARLRPDVVLMDVRMPRLNGIEATARIVSGPPPRPRVLVLTTFDADEYVYDALRAGAGGFLLKDVPEDHLVSSIRVVAEGGSLLDPALTRRLIEQFVVHRPDLLHAGLDELSPREREVLVQLARGLSNAEIAAELIVSDATIKTHVARILSKVGLRDRTQAVVLAYETGLVRPAGGSGRVA